MASPATGIWARAGSVLAALLALAAAPASAEPAGALVLELAGGRLVARQADGSSLENAGLIGLELRLGGGDASYVIRIDDVAPDPHAHGPSVTLYDVSVQDASGRWNKLCATDPHGRTTAIPVPGFWGRDGHFLRAAPGAFSFACTAGARGKCVRFGYRPWARAPNGDSLAPYHAACVRMVRADYCGDGTPHTVPGVAVEMFDAAGVHERRDPGYGAFEALWGAQGAVCLARSRRPEFPLADILRRCPRLAELPPAARNPAALDTLCGSLLGNRS